jgi:tight adherence protein B
MVTLSELPNGLLAACVVAAIATVILARDAASQRATEWLRRTGVPPGGGASVRLPGAAGRHVEDLLWRAGRDRLGRRELAALILLPLPFWLFARLRAARRSAKLRTQLPDGIEMLVEGLRIGQGLQASWQTVATQWPDMGREWRRVQSEMVLGLAWTEALAGMARRTPLPEHDLLVRAVALQQRTGVPLADVLARITETKRHRAELEGEMAALTAQGSLSGWVLGILPFGVAGLMVLWAPGHIGGFLAHPVGR